MVLNCGHHEACMYRFRHRGQTLKYCMACVIENSKVPEMSTEEWKQYCERKQPVEIVEEITEEKVVKKKKSKNPVISSDAEIAE